MFNVRPRSPYAGAVVKTKLDVGKDPISKVDLGNQDFQIEDWWENVTGKSWMISDGNIAAMVYGFRTGMRHGAVPIDNDVLYGKIGGLGFLFHVTELNLEETR